MSSGELDQTDEELAARAQKGDAVSYDLLARRYLRPAMALAWQDLRSVEEAEDAVQEAFHRAVRALPQFDVRRSFAPWFFTIVRNVTRTMRSKRGRRAHLMPTESLSEDVERLNHQRSSHQGSDRSEPLLALAFEQALSGLSEQQQACLRLCDVEGYTSAEAGDMLGLSEGTVRTHIHRARRRLRSELASDEGSSLK